MSKLEVAVAFFLVAFIVGMLHFPANVHASTYSANAVWFGENGTGWPSPNGHILSTNLTKCVNDLANNDIEYAIVFVGYWNATIPSKPNVVYYNAAKAAWVDALANYQAFYTSVINGFHGKGIRVIGWVEDGEGGAMDLTTGNRQNIDNVIATYMNLGFDGYNDDVEGWTGSHQIYIDYLNNLTTFSHTGANFADGKPRLNMPDVGFDSQQNTNQYLNVDYIVSMFYSNVSALENQQAAAYWQEDFGEYHGNNNATPPASPMIMGLMNDYGNKYPLTWQLGQVDKYLLAFGHPQLAGFCLWLYEYMGANPNDWSQWNYWITRVGTNTPLLCVATITSSPVTGTQLTVNGTQQYTPNIQYGFNGTVIILHAPPIITQYTFLNWSNGTNATTISVTLTSNTTIAAMYTPAIPEHNVPVLPAPFMIAMAITMLLVIIAFKKNKKQHSNQKRARKV